MGAYAEMRPDGYLTLYA
ncbi:hypothetical protein, partial [Kitasatospora sp. NPDC047058]